MFVSCCSAPAPGEPKSMKEPLAVPAELGWVVHAADCPNWALKLFVCRVMF